MSGWGLDTELNEDGNGAHEQLALERMKKGSCKLLESLQKTYPKLAPMPEPEPKPKALWPVWYKPPSSSGVRSAKDIIHEVGARFGFSYDEMVGGERHQKLARARQTAYTVLRSRGNSYPQIGKFTNRDHSTVIYGIEQFKIHAARDPYMWAVHDSFVERADG